MFGHGAIHTFAWISLAFWIFWRHTYHGHCSDSPLYLVTQSGKHCHSNGIEKKLSNGIWIVFNRLDFALQGRLDGNGRRSHLLFFGRCFPQTTRWFPNFKNTTHPVSLFDYFNVVFCLWARIHFQLFYFCRRKLFDESPEFDNNYTPLPEDRPGGFNWGEEQAPNNQANNDE